MQQRQNLHFDDGSWLASLNFDKIRIGGAPTGAGVKGFTGSVSCIQVFDQALHEAEISLKKNCPNLDDPDAEHGLTRSPNSACPKDFELIYDMCYKVVYFLLPPLRNQSIRSLKYIQLNGRLILQRCHVFSRM